MNEILNPYIAGAPVTETSMFFGREDVFSWIERSLAGKYVDHILVLHGQRRVGKTSVLKQIPNFLPDQYIQVFFDLQGRTNTTLDRFLWWLAREIARTLKQERDITIPRPDRDDFKADPEYLINEFIPSLRPIIGDHDLLLTFDEFDTLDRPDIQESLAEPLIAYLRRLMEMEGLSFIFSIGSAGDKLENMQASYTDFFKSALYRKISFLTRDDCHRLITKPVEGVIQYDRKAVDRIFEISSGHPYFTQLMCHELFSLCQKTGARSISKADVESVLDDVIERGTVNLKFVWDEASDLEKWILAGLAHLDGGATTQKLIELLQEQRVRFSEPDLHSAIIHMRDKDIITEENQFVIHLMRMWLQANRTLDRVREELVEVNPIANRYIEIGDEYRDMGQADQAIESYQQALEADPGNLKAQSSIGAVHLVGQAYTEALAAFELALQIDDEDVVARTGFCDANLALGDQARSGDEKDEAVGFYRKILVINPAHTDARQRLADIYSARAEESLSAGQDDEALIAFNSALEFTPEDNRLTARYQAVLAQKKARVVAEWLVKSDKALERQRWDEAADAVQEALRLDPENQELQSRVAEVKDAPRQYKIQDYKAEAEGAIQRGDFEKAIAAIGTAMQLAPEDESLPEWRESTRSDQLNARLNVYQEQARKAIAVGDWDAAIEARKAALKLSPDDATLQKELDETQAAQLQAQLDALRSQAEGAITAGNWAAAITARKNAIKLSPDDAALRKELVDTEAAQLSAQLDTFSSQAEGAIQAGEWDTAIRAYEEAKELAPDDPTWNDKIETTRAAQLQTQLDAFQEQADEAISRGDWEPAILAIREAIKIAPDEAPWQNKLTEIEAAHHQAQLQAYRQGADSARAAGDWDAAIAALEGYLALEPGDAEIQSEIETLRQGKRRSELAAFKTQAEAATAAEKWDDVVAAWEGYLALEPEDQSEVEEAHQHARKYARISSDFDEAQQAIRKRRYGRAIVLLQGIIAQDPTFKSTSRLLVEAVEADKATPIWRRSWVYGVLAFVVVVVLGVIFGPKLFSAVTANRGGAPDQTAIAVVDGELGETIEPTFTPALALISTDPPATETGAEVSVSTTEATPSPEQGEIPIPTLEVNQAFYEPILAYIDSETPTFEDDFSTAKSEWGSFDNAYGIDIYGDWSVEDLNQSIEEVVADGVLHFVGTEKGTELIPQTGLFQATDFAMEFDFEFVGEISNEIGNMADYIGLRFRTSEDGRSYYEFYIDPGLTNWYINKVHQGFTQIDSDGVYEKNGTVLVIAQGDQFAVFLDGVLINTFQDSDNNGIQIFIVIAAMLQTPIDIDNVKFWNLDGVEIGAQEDTSTDENVLDPILSYLDSQTPTFEDDFSTANPEWGSFDNVVADGVLHYVGTDEGVNLIPSTGLLDASDFAIAFDFNFAGQFGDPRDKIGLRFRSTGDTYYDFNIEPGMTYWYVNKVDQGFTRIDSGGVSGKYGTVLVVAQGDQIAVFLDDQLLTEFQDSDITGIQNFIYIAAELGRVIDIDNVRFWNLEGVEIGAQAETPAVASQINDVLDFISEQSPTFEDDFSSPKSEWGRTSSETLISEYISNGVFNLPDNADFPINGLLNATNFVIQYDFDFKSKRDPAHGGQCAIPLIFRESEDGKQYYNFRLENKWQVTKRDVAAGEYVEFGSGDLRKAQEFSANARVISWNDWVYVYLDDTLLTKFQDNDFLTGEINYFINECGDNNRIDNLKFWNLDGVEIDAQAGTPTSEETSAFYEPILAYLAEGHTAFQQDDNTNTDKYYHQGGFWQVRTGEGSLYSENGYRLIKIFSPFDEMTFPLFGYINATDFAIQYDAEFIRGYQLDGFGLYFRASNNLDAYYKILYSSSDGGWILTKDDGTVTMLGRGSHVFEPFEFNTFLIIAKQENLAIFVDGELIIEVNDLEFSGIDNFLVATSLSELSQLKLDNFKFWNLNGVDF